MHPTQRALLPRLLFCRQVHTVLARLLHPDGTHRDVRDLLLDLQPVFMVHDRGQPDALPDRHVDDNLVRADLVPLVDVVVPGLHLGWVQKVGFPTLAGRFRLLLPGLRHADQRHL